MSEVPRGFEVQCGNILIISEYPPAIILDLKDNCVETSEVGSFEGQELIHFGGGTVIASYIDRVGERWSKERMERAIIIGIDFYIRRARQSREFSEEKRLDWINSSIEVLNGSYHKPPIILT